MAMFKQHKDLSAFEKLRVIPDYEHAERLMNKLKSVFDSERDLDMHVALISAEQFLSYVIAYYMDGLARNMPDHFDYDDALDSIITNIRLNVPLIGKATSPQSDWWEGKDTPPA